MLLAPPEVGEVLVLDAVEEPVTPFAYAPDQEGNRPDDVLRSSSSPRVRASWAQMAGAGEPRDRAGAKYLQPGIESLRLPVSSGHQDGLLQLCQRVVVAARHQEALEPAPHPLYRVQVRAVRR